MKAIGCDSFSAEVARMSSTSPTSCSCPPGAEGVHADDREGPVVFPGLVEKGLVLDPAALVAGLHGAEDTAAVGQPVELAQHGLFDEVGELFDQVGTLLRVVAEGRPHSLLMIIWIASARRTDSGVGVVTASS